MENVTLKDVSKRIGVSVMTVSRALRDADGVSAALREEIRRTAREMNYSADRNFAARSLKSRATGDRAPDSHVACLMLRQDVEEDAESFHGAIRSGFRAACAKHRYDAVLVDYWERSLPRVVLRGQVSGVVRLLQPHEVTAPLPCPVPWVSILHEVERVDSVLVDNFAAGRELGRHLAELGHRRAAYLGPDFGISHERLAGIRTGLGAVDEELLLLAPNAGSRESSETLARRLLETAGGPEALCRRITAVSVYNDYMAIYVIDTLRAAGLRVPEDVSVTGFDGVLPVDLRHRGVHLTTAAVPLAEIGGEALRLLTLRLRDTQAPPWKVSLPATFVRGATTAPPHGCPPPVQTT